MDKNSSTKILQERIRERLKVLGLSANAASVKAGLSRGIVSYILRTENPNLTFDTYERLARTLDCDVDYLIAKQDTVRYGSRREEFPRRIPIVGSTAAGVFSEMTGPEPWLSDYEFEQITAPSSLQYPQARHFAMRITGDSMNAARPRPILDGEVGLFVDVVDAETPVIDGRIYLVRRTRDAGSTFEWTLKRARIFKDRIELTPESHNSVYKPFVIARSERHDDHSGEEIVAVGLLYGMYQSFENI